MKKIRQKNIREREEKLLSLGIIPHVNQPKKNATLVKSTIKINSVPVRSSPRLKGLQANEASEVIEEIQEEEKEKKYIPKRDLTLKELLSYECDPEELSEKESSIRNTFESYASLKCKRTSRSFLNLSKLKIKEDGASKVCRARITSMAFHPSTDQILLFVGDVHGYTSIFNLRDPENVHSFKSNDWTINCMSIDNHNASKLVTTSYDGSMKLLDLRTQQIELLYGEDFSFASYHSQIDAFQYLLSFGRKGTIGVIDLRRGKGKDFASKINVFPSGHVAKTVSYKDNLFVVGNSKSDCLVYDIRKSTSPYAELKGHSGAVSSAFFNPNPNSREILMTVKRIKYFSTIYLIKIQLLIQAAVWHPIEPYIFVGSMEKKPRRLDIFDSYGDIVKNLAGQWLTSTASVVIPHPVLNLVAGGNSSGRVWFSKNLMINSSPCQLNKMELPMDPTLSTLSNSTLKQKELFLNPNNLEAQASSLALPPETGVPIPKRMNDELNNLDEIFNGSSENDRVPNLLNRFEASPLGPTSPWDKSIVKMEMEMNLDMGNQGMLYDESNQQPTLAQLNSPPLETDFNSELNWDSFFTNDEARNSESTSENLLSSSVPTQPHGNSPLSDIILPDFNPTSPGNIIAVSPSVISSGPPPRSASFSGQRPVIVGPAQNRPSPVRSPESRSNKTLIQMKSSLLSASNPLLSQQLSKSAPNQHSYLELCSVGGESSITDEVNDVLNGLSPTDLPDIASDDEDPDEDKNMENEEDSSNDDISDDDEDSPDKYQSTSKHDAKKKRDTFGNTMYRLRHSGKARRGDGNDLTSNPKKLASIGRELETTKQSVRVVKKRINWHQGLADLRKKAQHEANKLKCCGLRDEHQVLIGFINRSKEILKAKVDPNNLIPQSDLTAEMDQMVKKANKQK
ncbi:unnamed protein product [Lepeophtheirus salmonis]|uniref:WD repeat-containing protein 76 n=1 Tax=Lepeophtheirus salmonis TaxID=72036 RepID=A0A7R8CNT9_LEPSM|nr:unnamed protein product [Lepeophtheirus salmonis]CAF2844565.1 unnamed protein product [Lepeophtheirus salmonis]